MSQSSPKPLSIFKSTSQSTSNNLMDSQSPLSRSPTTRLLRAMSHHAHGHGPSASASSHTAIKRNSTSPAHAGGHDGMLSRLPSLHISEHVSSPKSSSDFGIHYSNNIEDYDIQDTPIGYGSSASVFVATYKPRNSKVAIKVIDLDTYDPNELEKLRSETSLMALSKHPNLLSIYSTFAHDAKLYIVTPLLAGGSCLDIMRTSFPNGFEEVVIATILKQTLEGLSYLHKHDYIHRDVKAGNLLMDVDGSVIVADFGVSRSLTERNESRRTFVGTPCWMAPEVMEQQEYNWRVDIWSFGITAYELATGHAPLSKFPPLKVIMMTLRDASPSLDKVETLHKYSRLFKDMINLCLQKDPFKRPSCEQLLQHPFFKQAKKKDFLIKNVLAHVPPIQSRKPKQVPVKKTISSEDDHLDDERQEWDFDDSQLNSSRAQCKLQIPIVDVLGSSVAHTASPDTITPIRKSRFVIEDSRDAEQHNTVSSIRSTSSFHSDHHVNDPPFGLAGTDGKDGQQDVEIKKGRFSVNQQSHRSTPTGSVAGGTETSTEASEAVSSTQISRAPSHDNLGERKVKFDNLPLSREPSVARANGSISRTNSISKSGRFNGVKDEPPANTMNPASASTPVTHEQTDPSTECWKKGRFQLTGSSTPGSVGDLRGIESPQSTVSGCSASSVSGARLDPTFSHFVYSHLENLLRQTEAQRTLLHELLIGMSFAHAGSGNHAQPPSSTTPMMHRSRSVSIDAKHGGPHDEFATTRPPAGSDVSQTLDHLQHLLHISSRERERVTKENEALRRELERLRRAQATPTVKAVAPLQSTPVVTSAPMTGKHTPPLTPASVSASASATSTMTPVSVPIAAPPPALTGPSGTIVAHAPTTDPPQTAQPPPSIPSIAYQLPPLSSSPQSSASPAVAKEDSQPSDDAL